MPNILILLCGKDIFPLLLSSAGPKYYVFYNNDIYFHNQLLKMGNHT